MPWEAITKIHGQPWNTQPDEADTSVSNVVSEWTVCTMKLIKMFAENMWKLLEDHQDKYIMTKQLDNDLAGCNAWASCISSAQKSWGLNAMIDDILSANGSAPHDILKSFKKRMVCYDL